MPACLRRGAGGPGLLQMAVNAWANVDVFCLQVSEPLLATSGGTVRKIQTTKTALSSGSVCFGTRDKTGLGQDVLPREQPYTHTHTLPPKPTSTYANTSQGSARQTKEKDETNTDSSPLTRLPRPRRPPPRHVLRQAGGPEGRGSWSDLEGETTEEEEEEESEADRREGKTLKKKKQCGDIRNGRRRESGACIIELLQRIEEARCTYTATTPSKRMILEERSGLTPLSPSSRSPVSARKWRLVLFFCPALFRVSGASS
jgi:hypothetical protein